jgi:A/G-specific adenine glycosylase
MTKDFNSTVWNYYTHNKRVMPWRELADESDLIRGYRVFVSEVMLQQTQVNRVIDKYNLWMERWPTIDAFVNATLADVLVMWSGLGYNRRAKYLYESLQALHKVYGGKIPSDVETLQTLPGIGPNTAAAVIVYTYNKPVPFIETNIRTVYLHSFFAESEEKITDKEITILVEQTLDQDNPREWFYALMDYGAYLKKNHGNKLHKSLAHKQQSTFNGSKRQVRGKVIKLLTNLQYININELALEIPDDRLEGVIQGLVSEGLIIKQDAYTYTLPNR